MKNNQLKPLQHHINHLLFTVALMFSLIIVASAAPGDLDPTFGNGGFAATLFTEEYQDNAFETIVQPDGKILMSGRSSGQQGIAAAFIARYHADGTLDQTFGTAGKIISPVGGGEYIGGYTLILQPDGKIVAVGVKVISATDRDFVVARYRSDGKLDLTFGTNGKVFTSFGSGIDTASDALLQSDGKIVVIGSSQTSDGYDYAAARYNGDGSLDTSFGTNGKVITAISSGSDFAQAAVLQTDGKIIVGGHGGASASDRDYAVVRYNADGSLDGLFGAGGKVITAISSGNDSLYDLALQSDGKIVAAGQGNFVNSSNYSTVLIRYNPNGSIDTTFAQNGILDVPYSSGYYVGNAVTIQPNGKILAFGFGIVPAGDEISRNAAQTEELFSNNLRRKGNLEKSNDLHRQEFIPDIQRDAPDGGVVIGLAAARYNADGSPDTTFGTNGKVITPVGSGTYSYGFGITVQPDGKILGCGTGFGYAVIVRYLGDSTGAAIHPNLDPTFGTGGRVITDLPAANYARQVEVQPDGKIVVLGRSRDANGGNLLDAYLVRYNADGTIDTAFGSGGVVRANCQTECFEDGFVILPDGKILIAGSVGTPRRFGVFRLNPNGTRDTAWGANGVVAVAVGGENSFGHEILVQPDGKIVILGMAQRGTSTNFDIGIARLNPNRSLDTSFGTNGVSVVPIANGLDSIRIPEARLQADGKFLFLVQSSAIVGAGRINANGTLDTSFATSGFLAVDAPSWRGQALALQPDGKFILAMRITSVNSTIARYNPDGTPDNSFGTKGKVVFLDVDCESFAVFAVVVEPNGKIIVGGARITPPVVNFAVLRLNPNGSIDTSLGVKGLVSAPSLGVFGVITAMKLQPDGKLVTVGETLLTANGNVEIGLARFLLNSSRTRFDFDGDGKADIAVFRQGNWYITNSSNNSFRAAQFGFGTDRIAPADFDGDGRADLAVFRDGTWYLQRSTEGFTAVNFGQAGDIPVPADYDGDGRADVAVFRAGDWYILQSSNNTPHAVQFGLAMDRAVPADYDGDGKTDVAVYRDGTWYLLRSRDGFGAIQFGQAGDQPVPADYDADGRADAAVFRAGVWYLLRSTQGFAATQFGLPTDVPVPADYDGDGRTDIAVYRDGVWYLLRSASGFFAVQFGLPNDKPIPSAFAP